MASSSSSSSSASCKYDVFLNFRGEDTRDNFTSHLDSALRRKKLNIFIDEELERGDEISPVLLNAIETSKISVTIFSENYASSRWCLDELVKILECKKMNGQIVIPIFYHVDPSDVRKQTRRFGDAFVELAKRFKKMPEKVQKWKAVLTEASNLSGWNSMKIRREAELVDEIVKDILKKLRHTSVSNDFEGFIGLHSRIERVKSLLCMGLPDFRILGIWGMGGIGKTTIAATIFHQISVEFEGKSFMADVRDETERIGLVNLRARVLSEILEEDIRIGTPNLPGYIKERLKRMKVFIIFDDVNKPEQLEFLAGGLNRFGPGSRIIVTTRNKYVLDRCGVDYIYEVEKLKYHEANKLFCNYAFKQDYCPQDLQELLKNVNHYAFGNPLALKVLGSSFNQKTKEECENLLHKLKQISDSQIYNVLKVSYDELTWEEKNIFLDVACFFKGVDKSQVIRILADRYSVDDGLKVLVSKSLITIFDNTLQMHDLLQEMGRKIVYEECEKEPGKRSRLWYHEDVCRVLKKNKGTDEIEGMFLNLSKISDIHLHSTVFANMSNLKLLKFYMPEQFGVSDMNYKVHLPEGLEFLPEELRYLHWHGYPLRTLPLNFNPENLIELNLPCSKLQQLWEGKKEAPKLKSIDLQHSQCFSSIPEPLETPILERINLLNCTNLSCIPLSIQNFNHLGLLCLEGCKSLRCFPNNIHFSSPITINFSLCSNMTEFPQISGNIIDLDLQKTAIEEIPSSIERLTRLEKLNMRRCKRLSLSARIGELKSLRSLNLSSCSKVESFPEILEQMESLQCISLASRKTKVLPSFFELQSSLVELSLSYLHNIDSWVQNAAAGRPPSSISYINKLEKVQFYRCGGLVLPTLSGLSNLTELSLNDSDIMEIPQDIGCLFSLEKLDLKRNNFENLPTSIKQLSQLRQLDLSGCNMLQSLPELPLSLQVLDASNCERLESLPKLPDCPENLGAFLLETQSQSSHSFSQFMIKFIFSNCPKLNKKKDFLADSQQRIRHMAVASLNLLNFLEKAEPPGIGNDDLYDGCFHDTEFAKQPGMSIYLPGSGIPEWFSNQCSGSSITIQLRCKSNLIGFALCAVFGFKADSDVLCRYFEVKCSYSFEIKTPSRTENFGATSLTKCTFIELDHVLLGFNPCRNLSLPDDDHYISVTFQFFIDYFCIPFMELPAVKCCGVCPVYAHPNETHPNTFTVNMLPQNEEECRKLHNELHNQASTSASATRSGSIDRSGEEETNALQQQSSFLSQIFRCWGLDCTCLWGLFRGQES